MAESVQRNGVMVKSDHRTSALATMAARYGVEPTAMMDTLKATVIKPDRNGRPATNGEVAAFVIVANQYGLNPFTREIYAFSSGEKGIVPIVPIDGWARIVNREEKYDGCEFEDVADEAGDPVAITCIMHVKGRTHPTKVTERYKECKKNTAPWQTWKWRMLRHKAFMQAARLAFSLGGIYDEDEAREIVGNHINPDADAAGEKVDRLNDQLASAAADAQDAEFTDSQPPSAGDAEPEVPPYEETQIDAEVDAASESSDSPFPAMPDPCPKSWIDDVLLNKANRPEGMSHHAAKAAFHATDVQSWDKLPRERQQAKYEAVLTGEFPWKK